MNDTTGKLQAIIKDCKILLSESSDIHHLNKREIYYLLRTCEEAKEIIEDFRNREKLSDKCAGFYPNSLKEKVRSVLPTECESKTDFCIKGTNGEVVAQLDGVLLKIIDKDPRATNTTEYFNIKQLKGIAISKNDRYSLGLVGYGYWYDFESEKLLDEVSNKIKNAMNILC